MPGASAFIYSLAFKQTIEGGEGKGGGRRKGRKGRGGKGRRGGRGGGEREVVLLGCALVWFAWFTSGAL